MLAGCWLFPTVQMHGGCAGGEVGEEHKRGVDSVGCTRGQSCLK